MREEKRHGIQLGKGSEQTLEGSGWIFWPNQPSTINMSMNKGPEKRGANLEASQRRKLSSRKKKKRIHSPFNKNRGPQGDDNGFHPKFEAVKEEGGCRPRKEGGITRGLLET